MEMAEKDQDNMSVPSDQQVPEKTLDVIARSEFRDAAIFNVLLCFTEDCEVCSERQKQDCFALLAMTSEGSAHKDGKILFGTTY